jgi:hypothetical protein
MPTDVNIDATTIVISADIGSTGTFLVVSCGTSNNLTGSLSAIDYSSKCGNKYGPGDKFDQSVEFDGIAIDQTGGTSKDSYSALYAAYIAKTKFPIRFGAAALGPTDHYFYGEVFIEKFDLEAPYNDSLKFKATFRVTVPPLAEYVGY